MNKSIISLTNPNNNKAFTLLELIIVIVIIGVLATIGFTQYSLVVEKARTVEAVARIGLMRKLATEYYLKNGAMDSIQKGDVGADDICTSTSFFDYYLGVGTSTMVSLRASRCTTGSGGKTPNASRGYFFYVEYYPNTGQCDWHCRYMDDNSACFGFPP